MFVHSSPEKRRPPAYSGPLELQSCWVPTAEGKDSSERETASINGITECCFQQQEQTVVYKWTSADRLTALLPTERTGERITAPSPLGSPLKELLISPEVGTWQQTKMDACYGKFIPSVKEWARQPNSTGSSLSATLIASESYAEKGLRGRGKFFWVINKNFFVYLHI